MALFELAHASLVWGTLCWLFDRETKKGNQHFGGSFFFGGGDPLLVDFKRNQKENHHFGGGVLFKKKHPHVQVTRRCHRRPISAAWPGFASETASVIQGNLLLTWRGGGGEGGAREGGGWGRG